jgi:hypothetical protein
MKKPITHRSIYQIRGTSVCKLAHPFCSKAEQTKVLSSISQFTKALQLCAAFSFS